MNNYKLWSNQEIELLKTYYPKLGKCKELNDLFPNRTLTAITVKAIKLKLHVLNNIRKGRTHEEYLNLIKDSNFICLDTYKGSTEKVLHKCKICSNEWLARPQHILKIDAKCPNCDHKSKFLTIEHVDTVLSNAGMERLSDYTGSLHKIKLKHIKCGHIWDTVYSYIQQGSGCPNCNTGFGYLTKENLPEKAFLYLLKLSFNKEIFYKVGVTINIARRINELKSRIKNNVEIEIIHHVEDTGYNTLIKERQLLNNSNMLRYISEIKFDGCTELLSISNNEENIINIMDNHG